MPFGRPGEGALPSPAGRGLLFVPALPLDSSGSRGEPTDSPAASDLQSPRRAQTFGFWQPLHPSSRITSPDSPTCGCRLVAHDGRHLQRLNSPDPAMACGPDGGGGPLNPADWDNVAETGLIVVLCLLWNTSRLRLGIGRRRSTRPPCTSRKMYAPFTTLVLFMSTVLRIAEACSSRSTPKPRPPSSTLRPNITFPTYACPPAYATWYCLNGATCFTVEISESILYNCVCADGYTGPRCEFKDLDGSYLPSREKILVEKASIASGVTIAVLLIVIISISFYIYSRRRKKEAITDVTDSGNGTMKPRPFSSVRSQRHLSSYRNSLGSRHSDVEAGSAGCSTGIHTHANSNTS